MHVSLRPAYLHHSIKFAYLHHSCICSYFKFLGPCSSVPSILLLAGLEISETYSLFNIFQMYIFALENRKFIDYTSVSLYQNSIENNCLRSWVALGQQCLRTRTMEDLTLSECNTILGKLQLPSLAECSLVWGNVPCFGSISTCKLNIIFYFAGNLGKTSDMYTNVYRDDTLLFNHKYSILNSSSETTPCQTKAKE